MTVTIQVRNLSEPDELVEFGADGDARLFGRDDLVCDIVIWSALNDPTLSRVAGRLWRMDGLLWLRNLSTSHELVVSSPGLAPDPPLPPRRDTGDVGAARCLPAGSSLILGPGGCELVVMQSVRPGHRHPATAVPSGDPGTPSTTGVPDVPVRLLHVALALCEPLLTGHPMPATYRQVAQRLGITSYKRVRLLVAELCIRYRAAASAPHLQPGPVGAAGRRTEPAPAPVQCRGVWRFPPPQQVATPPAPDLSLPDYVDVARLLVRRGLVRLDDLARLDRVSSDHASGGATSR